MTPAFGFSVGDFISAIDLIRKISKALKETGGAATEYQDAVIELKGLKHALQRLSALEPTEDNVTHVNAIRGMALACQLPLQEFLKKLEKYEDSLGPWVQDPRIGRTAFRCAGRKARWAVSFSQEVEKMRTLVAAKQISISLLLAMHTSQTTSTLSTRTQVQHSDLMVKVAEHRAAMNQMQVQIRAVDQRIVEADAASQSKLSCISSKLDTTYNSVVSIRGLCEQMRDYFGIFPQEIQGHLQRIMNSNWQMYQILLQIQQSLRRGPTSLLETNIRFEDALGEYRELPYEYFRHWEMFESFIRIQFRDKPGENQIMAGDYHILDLNNQGTIISKTHWTRSIRRGSTITMSIIMSQLRRKPGHCPRPGCLDDGVDEEAASFMLTCRNCHLNFHAISAPLEEYLPRSLFDADISSSNKDDMNMLPLSAQQLRQLASRPLATGIHPIVDKASSTMALRERQETQALQFFRNVDIAKESEVGPLELASYIVRLSEEVGLDSFGDSVKPGYRWVVNGCRCNNCNNIINNPEDQFGSIPLENGSFLCKKCPLDCHSCRRELGRSLMVNTNRAFCRMCLQCTICNKRVWSSRCFRSRRCDSGICMDCTLGACMRVRDKPTSLVSH